MAFAIIESGAKQYKISSGDEIDIELVESKDTHVFDRVLLISDGDEVTIGTPYIIGATVDSVITDPRFKDTKVVIFKYKNKTNYRKKTGHRQKYTRVKIGEIKNGS